MDERDSKEKRDKTDRNTQRHTDRLQYTRIFYNSPNAPKVQLLKLDSAVVGRFPATAVNL